MSVSALAALQLATLLAVWDGNSSPPRSGGSDTARRLDAIEARLDSLVTQLAEGPAPSTITGGSDAGAPPTSARGASAITERLDALTRLVESLDVARGEPEEVDEESLEAEDGYLIADRWAEDEKHGRAADGYLRFLAANPDHPDARDLYSKAVGQLQRAGYKTRALEVQKELLDRFPTTAADHMKLARMEIDQRHHDDAIASTERAIALENDASQRIWWELHRAWYIQRRDGDSAGLAEYRAVEQRIADLGLSEAKQGDRVRRHIQETETRLAGR